MTSEVLHFNVGVLGHVDSGKTSLSKVLSTVASTASFDKNPQSRERGITLDLGFSSFTVDVPASRQKDLEGFHSIQYTLVDCPGHASLIRTIIGGSQIIDLMILVIDITKGMQTQTAECLVIGEITCSKMIVVLNKTDMVPPAKLEATVEKMKKRMWKTLEATQFSGCPIVAVAAKPGGSEEAGTEAVGISGLISTLQENTYLPQRSEQGPFVFSVDHCFLIRGQGTVMTGTVLSGSISVSDTVEIPALGFTKKVKSMQMFRQPIAKIKQGDRAGVCVTQFDPSLLERGLVCSPGALVTIEAAIVSIYKIAYYKGAIATKSKFHITLGHETVMGKLSIFSALTEVNSSSTGLSSSDDTKSISHALDHLRLTHSCFDYSKEYTYKEELLKQEDNRDPDENSSSCEFKEEFFALVELEHPVTCASDALVIGSRLDTDIHTSSCRIAFYGKIIEAISDTHYRKTVLPKMKIFKSKTREGLVERAPDRYTVIGKNLFKKETNLQVFANLKVSLSSGERGVIEGGFGQSGKVKIRIPDGLSESTFLQYSGTSKKKDKCKEESGEEGGKKSEPVFIYLQFKRYVYDPDKTMIQS
ncbi:selenocysteine-specific elongation factor [Plakobranchus ocellatus]|uniref:Selenocysteine-specific elongation factor n=1 Tax=Plakobranchus ocellatus TaxID=259542 RepID=A0AAV4B0B8_9GAST|nr:selenocysteine-specific elongation factor [Plakobranchus ocellatus]